MRLDRDDDAVKRDRGADIVHLDRDQRVAQTFDPGFLRLEQGCDLIRHQVGEGARGHGNAQRFRGRNCKRIVSHDRGQAVQQREIARHRSGHVIGRGQRMHPGIVDQPLAGFEPPDAVGRGGNAKRAAGICANRRVGDAQPHADRAA